MISELDLISLEALILLEERPDFLDIQLYKEWLYICVMKEEYKHYTLSERYHLIYSLISHQMPHIIDNIPILIETFDEEEFSGVLKLYGAQEKM